MSAAMDRKIKELSDLYARVTGHHVYSGHSGSTYYFTGPISAYVHGTEAALTHIRHACIAAGIEM